eukprot:287253-Rhodomonas_salina.2
MVWHWQASESVTAEVELEMDKGRGSAGDAPSRLTMIHDVGKLSDSSQEHPQRPKPPALILENVGGAGRAFHLVELVHLCRSNKAPDKKDHRVDCSHNPPQLLRQLLPCRTQTHKSRTTRWEQKQTTPKTTGLAGLARFGSSTDLAFELVEPAVVDLDLSDDAQAVLSGEDHAHHDVAVSIIPAPPTANPTSTPPHSNGIRCEQEKGSRGSGFPSAIQGACGCGIRVLGLTAPRAFLPGRCRAQLHESDRGCWRPEGAAFRRRTACQRGMGMRRIVSQGGESTPACVRAQQKGRERRKDSRRGNSPLHAHAAPELVLDRLPNAVLEPVVEHRRAPVELADVNLREAPVSSQAQRLKFRVYP